MRQQGQSRLTGTGKIWGDENGRGISGYNAAYIFLKFKRGCLTCKSVSFFKQSTHDGHMSVFPLYNLTTSPLHSRHKYSLNTAQLVWFGFMVFNAPFNNISVIS